jgi:hypothetical protein
MENSNRRLLAVLFGALILGGCLCAGLVALAGGGLLIFNRQVTTVRPPEAAVTQPPTAELAPPAETPELETPDPAQAGGPTPATGQPATPPSTLPATGSAAPAAPLPPEIASQMDAIEQQVEALRGLQATGEVERALITPAELRQHVINDLLIDYPVEEARADARVLAAFGLLPPGFDLHDFYIELYSEQIAGYYDDETKKMYVIQDAGFRGPQRLTYAHEYTHALQNMHFDFEEGLGYSDEACEGNWARCAAVQALFEGDATVLEIEWFVNYATPQDAAELQEFIDNSDGPVFDSAPAFMQQDFLFPYESGRVFIEALHDQGGWQAVDQAYREPPASTEQILHPERYPGDAPIPVELPDLASILGAGWQEIDRDSWGEWYTYLILAHGQDPQARLEEEPARAAAQGWGGDGYIVYFNEDTDQTVMVLQTVWDSPGEAEQFGDAFRDYATARFGSPAEEAGQLDWDTEIGHTRFHRAGATTTWVFAPDSETAQTVTNALLNP